MHHYLIVEPCNGDIDLSGAPHLYPIGELVPDAMPELVGVMPMLYRAEHPDKQLPVLHRLAELDAELGLPPRVCALFRTQADSQVVFDHLRNGLALPKASSGFSVFRYYDPRVFEHLRWIFDATQLAALLGPAVDWNYLNRDGNWATVRRNDAPLAPLQIGDEQRLTLRRLGLIEQAFQAIRATGQPVDAQLPRLLNAQLAKGETYGLSAEDLVVFAVHGALVSPYFDRHPRVSAVLHANADTPYSDATAHWTDEDWHSIARESIQYQ